MSSKRTDLWPAITFRLLAVSTGALGLVYLSWRYLYSLNSHALWFAIPLVAAETYAFVNTLLFAFMLWKPAARESPPPLQDVTVDVFITTYDEPSSLLRYTVEAARRIDWPDLGVYVLDDGARPEVRSLAAELGCGYITRGEEWIGKPRHAKAGNVNNALMVTDGEFILILDADQIPDRRIVKETIGYFRDPALAFVQTPQHFYNTPPGDPFGTDATLFYGPIMQGKDGWNAAFFCGSNAILRREALLQLGVTEYVRDTRLRFERALKSLRRDVSAVQRHRSDDPAIQVLRSALQMASDALGSAASLERVDAIVRQGVTAAQGLVTLRDLLAIADTLRDLAQAGDPDAAEARQHLVENLATLSAALGADPGSLGLGEEALRPLDLTRADEAQPILPLATISITEDMATAMRLHALGWKSVFHRQILAHGLAPEDLRSALTQRLRWAQGTFQVLLRENPLFKRGLTFAQRIQYATTMLSYFDGFATLVFVLSPIVCMSTGLAPIRAPWEVFLMWLVPYLAINRLMFLYASRAVPTWRSEQYGVALFPLWIRAFFGTLFGRALRFVVTPKQRQGGNHVSLVWPQLTVILFTALAIARAVYGLVFEARGTVVSVSMNVLWGCYNISMLVPIVRAAVFRPPEGWNPEPPPPHWSNATPVGEGSR